MKHLARWMICLSFLLNTALFITLLILATVKTDYRFAAISLVCYPLSILILFLARKYINSNCKFYWKPFKDSNGDWVYEPVAWKIIKTILMPIVASGALIIHHLITITYTKMNEAIEDKTGFSLSSLGRTCQVLLAYFIAFILVFTIAELCGLHNDDAWREAMESIEVTILVFGGIIWILDTILWDVLDFAQKERAGFVKFKNISFLVIAVLCAIWGLPNLILCEAKDVFEYFGIAIVPICIHFCYYGVIRSGQVPQSRKRLIWGPISVAVVFIYATLLLNIVAHGRVLALLIYFLTVIAFGVVIYFIGLPFAATDGSYRLYYRQFNILNKYELELDDYDDDDDDDDKDERNDSDKSDKKKVNNGIIFGSTDIYSIMKHVAEDVKYSLDRTYNDEVIIARCVASDMDIGISGNTTYDISYKIRQTITFDFRECKETYEEKAIRDEYNRNYSAKMAKIKCELISQTYLALGDKKIDVDPKVIKVNFDTPYIEELRL